MRGFIKILNFIMIVFLAFFCSACQAEQNRGVTVKVTIVSSEDYTLLEGEKSLTLKVGENARFRILPKEGSYLSSVDYPRYELEKCSDGSVRVVLYGVSYSTRVHLTVLKDENLRTVRYDPNDGTGKIFSVRYELNGHLYPNTEIGTDRLERDGYTLIGWNTERDGSGASVGLGSRFPSDSDDQTLYGVWKRWSDADLFSYRKEEHGLTITNYLGNEREVCVPQKIDGISVRAIGSGAFCGKSFDDVYLPSGIERIEQSAFVDCSVSCLTFFDDLSYIFDESFENATPLRVKINAILPPVSPKGDRHASYADKVDLLRRAGKKKLVLFGGSGTYFSYDSALLQELLEDRVQVINMGLNAWFPLTPQMDIIGAFLRENDSLIHVPEMSSMAQLGATKDFSLESESEDGFDDRFFVSLSYNYDLVGLIRLHEITGFFDSYTRFSNERQESEEGSYRDNANYIDEHGDYSRSKPAYGFNDSISQEAELRLDYLTDEAMNRLNGIYQQLREKGVNVFYAFAAVNEHSLMKTGSYLEKSELFERTIREKLDVTVLGTINAAFFDGKDCFNSDWHLSDEASKENSKKLADFLFAHYRKDEA